MKYIPFYKAICFILLISPLFVGCNREEGGTTSGSATHFALYAVTTGADTLRAATPSIQPILVMKDGKFSDPVPNENGSAEEYDKALKAAFDQYLSSDNAYHVFRHGKEVGTASMLKSVENIENTTLASDVKLNVPNVTYPNALASNSNHFQGHPVRNLSSSERNEVVNLTRGLFSQNGIAGGLLDSVDVDNIKVFDVDGKGTLSFVGNAVIVHHKTEQPEEGGGEGGGEAFVATLEENLFIVAEKQNGTLTMLQSHFAPGSSDSTDLFRTDFIDALDLDGDGNDELVVMKSGSGLYSFSVLKRKNSKWEEVYKGAGGSL